MSPMDGRDELRGRFTRWIVITAEHAQKNYLRAEKKQLQTVPLEEADVAIVDTQPLIMSSEIFTLVPNSNVNPCLNFRVIYIV